MYFVLSCISLFRLVLFWENIKNGRNTISTASILLTSQRYTRDENKWYNCPIQREVRSPVVTYMEESGSHYLLWQEKTNQVWTIGGYKLQGNMNHRNNEQRNPAVVLNTLKKSVFVVFQEVINGNVYLFSQHVRNASRFSCTKGCGFNKKCVQQDVCISKNSSTSPKLIFIQMNTVYWLMWANHYLYSTTISKRGCEYSDG